MIGWSENVVPALWLAGAGVAAWLLTGALRRYAIARSLMDVPNHRSSHQVATPRGGGLAIVLVVAAGAIALMVSGGMSPSFTLGFVGGGAVVATAGWIDDHRPISAHWRALAYLLAATWFLAFAGWPEEFRIGHWRVALGPVAPLATALGLVWLINLFNFMDGIDGLAAGEALTAGGAGGAFLLAAGQPDLAMLAFTIAASAAGFLGWNWSPARIFLGDVGSAFLGFALGAVAIGGDVAGAVPVLIWLILLAVFLFDATLTLFRRLGREPFYVAHRRHAYQRAVAAGASHRAVTSGILLINAMLAALAVTAWLIPRAASVATIVVLLMLGAVYAMVERRRPMWSDRAT